MTSTALHSTEDIAAFLGDGETRLIAAAYRDTERAGELFVLPDNQARELRPWVKRELRCMFSDCSSPDLTTHARANRRDGFAHFRGGGKHAPESVNHRQGKAIVAGWLRRLYGVDTVTVEEATDTQRSNVADVLLSHPSGRRVAFEVQYAPLSVHAWRERHESYKRQDIIDVWLWGHTRVRRSRSSYATGPYRLDDTQDAMRQSDTRVTFLNPETAQIGVAVNTWKDEACLAIEREVDLAVVSLASVLMSDHGLTSELIAQLAAGKREYDAEMNRQLELEERRREEREAAAAAYERDQAERERVAQLRRIEREERRSRIAELRRKRLELIARNPDVVGRPQPLSPDGSQSRGQSVAASAQDPAARLRLKCRACGLPLDPMLAESGYHVGPCEWRSQ